MRTRTAAAFTAALLVLGATALQARQLRPPTRAAFDRYVQLTEARMAVEAEGRSPFLWIDRQPAHARTMMETRLARGDVISARLETRDGTKAIAVGDGLIHHWIGTVFLPGVTIDQVTPFVQDYARYPEVFGPLIQRARVIARTPTHFDVAMRTWMKKVKTVVIDADYGIDYRRLSAARLDTKSVAANIYEVESAGQAAERRIPGDQSSGFLWRLNTYCRFEETGTGTYEQCESISLTRDVPFGLGWLIRPFITGIPRDTLEFTLGRVRAGVARK